MPGSRGEMPTFAGRFCAGPVPLAVPPLSAPPHSPRSPAGAKPDSSPKGSRGLGIRAEFLKQTGTSAPRSPRQDAAVTKGRSHPCGVGHGELGDLARRGVPRPRNAITLVPIGQQGCSSHVSQLISKRSCGFSSADESSSQKAPWGINLMKKNKKSVPRAFGVRLEDCQPAPDNKVRPRRQCQPSGTLPAALSPPSPPPCPRRTSP